MFWVQRIAILGLASGIALSLPLWLNDRTFPMIPVIPYTQSLIPVAAQILLGCLAFFSALALIFSRQRGFTLMVVLLMLFVALQDFNRLQPWYFQYWTILVILIPLARKYKKYIEADYLLFGVQIAIASVYFFSGLFKFNDGFYDRIAPYMYQPITKIITTYDHIIYPTAYFIPPFEVAIAIGLFIPRIRLFAIIGGTLLHLGILILLGPIGLNENSVVWPWNVALILLLWIAFYKAKNFKLNLYLLKLEWPAKLIMLMVLVLPFLNLNGWYNEHISYEVYSGRSFTPHLRYHYTLIKNTPDYLQPYTNKYGDTVFVNIYKWSMEENNAPPNSDYKVILKVQEKTLEEFQ